jgi:hypothetical protein
VFNLTGMWALLSFSPLSGATANVVVLAVEAPIAYRLLKRWVWKHVSSIKQRREQVLFYVMYSLNICVAALVLYRAAGVIENSPHRVILAISIQWAVFSALWVGEFFICDRVLFKENPPASNGSGDSL